MKVGFIGTGSMGSLLIESFINSNALKPQQISASNRTHSKITELARRYQVCMQPKATVKRQRKAMFCLSV